MNEIFNIFQPNNIQCYEDIMPEDDGVRPYGFHSLQTGASKYNVTICSNRQYYVLHCIMAVLKSSSLSFLPLSASALGFPLSGISLNHQRFNESFYAPAPVLVSTYVRPSHFVVMVLGKLPVPGRPTFYSIVGQGPTALAVGAGGGLFGHFYSRLSFLSSFSLSLGDGPI